MEAFESFVAVALESENFVVSSAVKFNVKLKTKKAAYEEFQSHGYEVDLIGSARRPSGVGDGQVILRVTRGCCRPRDGETGNERWKKLYALLNNEETRGQVVGEAASRYGYSRDQVELRLYVGRFAAPKKRTHETEIRRWAAGMHVGAGPIRVYGLKEIVGAVRTAAEHKQYRDDPVLVTMKVLQAAGELKPTSSS